MKSHSRTSLKTHETDLFADQNGADPSLIADSNSVADQGDVAAQVGTTDRGSAASSPTGRRTVGPRSQDDLRPGGAKVRLNVARLSDDELRQACKNHLAATKDNPLFDDLSPDEEAYEALVNDFFASTIEIANLKLKLEAAYVLRDAKRAALEVGTRQRIAGVQIVSRGDSKGIAAAGFHTQKSPSPIGILSPPEGLAVTLSDTSRRMEITWNAVKKNRGYLLQYAEGKMGDENPAWTMVVSSKPGYVFNDMTPTTSYLFRVATIGGKGGHSAWSPTVVRIAH